MQAQGSSKPAQPHLGQTSRLQGVYQTFTLGFAHSRPLHFCTWPSLRLCAKCDFCASKATPHSPAFNPSSEPMTSCKPVTNDSPVQPPACGLGSVKNHLLTNGSVLHLVFHPCAWQAVSFTIAHNIPLLENSYSASKAYFKCSSWGVRHFWQLSFHIPASVLFPANHSAVTLHIRLSLEGELSHQLGSGLQWPSGSLGWTLDTWMTMHFQWLQAGDFGLPTLLTDLS